jgi:hypothetical protein
MSDEVVGQQSSEVEVEFTTREEYIGCAFNGIMAVSDMDLGECVKEMHDELFENEEED